MRRCQCRKSSRQHVVCTYGIGSNTDRLATGSQALLAEHTVSRIVPIIYFTRVLKEATPRIGKENISPATLKQLYSKALFQRCNILAYSRLRNAQLTRSDSKTAKACNSQKNL